MDKKTRVAEQLDAIDPRRDPESAHAKADELLLSAAPKQVREAYERLVERAPWWATA